MIPVAHGLEQWHVECEEIPRVAAPRLHDFRRSFEKPCLPVVLTGVVGTWPAMYRWTLDDLARRLGHVAVVAVELKEGRVNVGVRQPGTFVKVNLGEYIAGLRNGEPVRHYVSTPMEQLASELADDYRLPTYCEGAAWIRPKLWVGRSGTVSPLHFDLKFNLYAVVTGKKRFLLYPRAQSRLLYPCGLFSKAPNFARVDPEMPDALRFPRFARARPVGCIVHAGEMIYIPRGWWHHVRTLEDSIAIGFWYGGHGTAALSAAASAFRRVRRLSMGEWG